MIAHLQPSQSLSSTPSYIPLSSSIRSPLETIKGLDASPEASGGIALVTSAALFCNDLRHCPRTKSQFDSWWTERCMNGDSKFPSRSLLVLLGCPFDKDTITPLSLLGMVREGGDAVRVGLARRTVGGRR